MTRAYRKKPVVVEAVRWTGENHGEMCEFIDPEVFEITPHVGLVIHTLEGDHHASPGDYIIKGVNGEFYPCKPDVFEKTYEPSTFTPPNEPLTLEELRKIDTVIPLWVHNLSWGQHKPRLMLVRHVTSNYWSCVDFDGFETIKSDDYGSRYLIYRRPPEGEV